MPGPRFIDLPFSHLTHGLPSAILCGVMTPITRKPDGTFAKQREKLWDETDWDDGFINGKRFKVYRPDFPRTNVSGWALRSLVVWWLNTGQVPEADHVIHHKNEDKLDDRFDNLECMTHSQHQKHHRGNDVECVCGYCGRTFIVPQWRINQGRGKWCSHQCGILGGRWKQKGSTSAVTV